MPTWHTAHIHDTAEIQHRTISINPDRSLMVMRACCSSKTKKKHERYPVERSHLRVVKEKTEFLGAGSASGSSA